MCKVPLHSYHFNLDYEEDQQSDDVRVQQQACPCSVDESTNVTDRFGKTLSNEFSDDDPSCLFSHGGHIEAREKSVVSRMSHGNCNVTMFGKYVLWHLHHAPMHNYPLILKG